MNTVKEKPQNSVKILLGFDCDRPRATYIETPDGSKMAEIKMKSLEYISHRLDFHNIPRTYFLCGQFIESMVSKFNRERLSRVFNSNNSLIEIADHTYSHNIFKAIPSRPDKTPINVSQIIQEYRINTKVFFSTLGLNIPIRGIRTPLGYYEGLGDKPEIVEALKAEGVLYISSDLRDKDNSINPPLRNGDGTLRQPYFYSNRLLEIPSHGLHDTAFGNQSKTQLLLRPPSSLEEILIYYSHLFEEAMDISKNLKINFYVGLVLHPYNISLYDPDQLFIDKFLEVASNLSGEIEFSTYQSVYDKLSLET